MGHYLFIRHLNISSSYFCRQRLFNIYDLKKTLIGIGQGHLVSVFLRRHMDLNYLHLTNLLGDKSGPGSLSIVMDEVPVSML